MQSEEPGSPMLFRPTQIMRRANVLEGFLKAGIPLSQIDDVRPLLEANNARLTDSTHMASLIPFFCRRKRCKSHYDRRLQQHPM